MSDELRRFAEEAMEHDEALVRGEGDGGRGVMRLLSALFDTTLLPLAVLKDVVDFMCGNSQWKAKSDTRKKLEEIEDNLR